MNKEEIEKLKREDILYDKTQKFGRTQFVRELARLEEENKELKKQLSQYQFMIAKIKDLKGCIGKYSDNYIKISFEEILKGDSNE